MPEAGIIRLEPTIKAMGVIVQTCAVGIFSLSSSFVIAAPQRVLVPHVDVNMTPSTLSALSFSAMPRPIFRELSKLVLTPAVEYIR